mmetsp:Transcript_33253/g.98080  ORF Transcript_33253/g.98080 Transcript_33253/m.98080 type:complete len:229 (+) Transcript_33253:1567-2253(+)
MFRARSSHGMISSSRMSCSDSADSCSSLSDPDRAAAAYRTASHESAVSASTMSTKASRWRRRMMTSDRRRRASKPRVAQRVSASARLVRSRSSSASARASCCCCWAACWAVCWAVLAHSESLAALLQCEVVVSLLAGSGPPGAAGTTILPAVALRGPKADLGGTRVEVTAPPVALLASIPEAAAGRFCCFRRTPSKPEPPPPPPHAPAEFIVGLFWVGFVGSDTDCWS